MSTISKIKRTIGTPKATRAKVLQAFLRRAEAAGVPPDIVEDTARRAHQSPGVKATVGRAPLVPCLECGRMMPLVLGSVDFCAMAGGTVPFAICERCSARRARKLASTPGDLAAILRADVAGLTKLAERHRRERVLPVVKALLRNAQRRAS